MQMITGANFDFGIGKVLSPKECGLDTNQPPRFFPDIDDIRAKLIQKFLESRVEMKIKANLGNPRQADFSDLKREIERSWCLKVVPCAIVAPLVRNQNKELNVPRYMEKFCTPVTFCLITAGV